MLLLLTGMETDLKLVRKFGRAAIAVSLAGVAVPFACGQRLPGCFRRKGQAHTQSDESGGTRFL